MSSKTVQGPPRFFNILKFSYMILQEPGRLIKILHDPPRSFMILQDPSRSFKIIKCFSRSWKTFQDVTSFFNILQVPHPPSRSFKIINDPSRSLKILQDPSRYNKNWQDHPARSFKIIWCSKEGKLSDKLRLKLKHCSKWPYL